MTTSATQAGTVDLLADVEASLAIIDALEGEDKARAAQALWPQVLAIQARVAAIRAEGVLDMRAAGASLATVGKVLDMSITRVKQLERRAIKKEGPSE